MARISLDPPRTLLVRFCEWYSNRQYGKVLDPLKAVGHHPGVLAAYGVFEGMAERWSRVDKGMKQLVVANVAARIGCSWCMDFGYWESQELGLSAEKMRSVVRWRDSDLFTARECAALAYAEAMTETPPAVTDDLVSRLREHLDEAQLVELTMMISLENLRSRTNAALGLHSQGFSERCEVPLESGGTHVYR